MPARTYGGYQGLPSFTVNYPDGMSEDQINQAEQQYVLPPSSTSNQVNNPSLGQEALVGLGHGLNTWATGIKQKGLLAGEAMGLVPQGSADAYQHQIDADNQFYNKTAVGNSLMGNVTDTAGKMLPYLAVPGAWAGRAAQMGVNGLLGMLQYTPEGGSALQNGALSALLTGAFPLAAKYLPTNPATIMGISSSLGAGINYLNNPTATSALGGAIVGAAAPFVPTYAGRGLANLTNAAATKLGFDAPIKLGDSPLQTAAQHNMLKGVDDEAIARHEAGLNVGVFTRPSESSNNPLTAAQEGKLGRTDRSIQKLYEGSQKSDAQQQTSVNDTLNSVSPNSAPAYLGARNIAQQVTNENTNAIINPEQERFNSFLNNLSPNSDDAAPQVRKAANDAINAQIKIRKDNARPIYDQAFKEEISPQQLNQITKNPVINSAIMNVQRDPVWQSQLQGYGINSIKALDLAKADIDRQINLETDGRRMAGLVDAKSQLTAATDKFSPTYAQARQIYSADSPEITNMQNSMLGKIANKQDTNLKDIPGMVFNSKMPKSDFNTLVQQLNQQRPGITNQLLRNHFEQQLGNTAGVNSGAKIHDELFSNPNQFNVYNSALGGNRPLQTELNGMKNDFSNSSDLQKALQQTVMGRIANVKDMDAHQIGNILFDPNKTSPQDLAQVRDIFLQRDPETWYALVRNHMENALNAPLDENNNSLGVGQQYIGSKFFKKILANDKQYNQYTVALQKNPTALQRMRDSKTSFGGFINPVTPRTAGRMAQQNTSAFRENTAAAWGHLRNLFGGQYDNAAVDLINSPKWVDAYKQIRGQTGQQRSLGFASLLGRLAAGAYTTTANARE